MKAFKRLGFGLLLVVAVSIPIMLVMVLPGWLLLACVVLLGAWMVLTHAGRLTAALSAVGIGTLPQRLSSSSVIVVGIAGVVGVLIALLAMAAGFEATLKQTGTDDTAIILSSGSRSEVQSALERGTIATITQEPQIERDAQGQPMYSIELVVASSFKKKDGNDANVEIRGVGEHVWEIRPNAKIGEGRRFKAGLNELAIGARVRERFVGMDIGSTLVMRGQPWRVVGIFDSRDAYSSEIWGDTNVIASAFHRESSPTSVTVKLVAAQDFEVFRAAIANDRRLKVKVQTSRQFYSEQSGELTHLIRMLGTIVAAIMAVGALFGTLNIMYAAISTRAREIATLRAIGFHGGPVVGSVLLEAIVLASLGGVLGAVIARIVFDGFTASTMGIIFAFNVSPELMWNGLRWALAMGLMGGIFPAFRAARAPITTGLREL